MGPVFIFEVGQINFTMYPWHNSIPIDRKSPQAIYLQIVNSIISAIHEGRLVPGQKLPGARMLSESLKLNRKTIVAAIDELVSQGWLESLEHKGTFVSKKLPHLIYEPLQRTVPDSNEIKTEDVNPLPWLEALHLDFKNRIQIDDGVPDVRLAPIDALIRIQRSLLSRNIFKNLLRYTHIEGDINLRTTLTAYLRDTRGIKSATENIFITRGSQMALYLAIAAIVKNGDACITSFPGYQIVDNIITHLGGTVAHVSIDHDGLIVTQVEALCKRNKIKLLYITPHHHYPTTVTLSPTRRIELLRLAKKYNFYILEDDYAYDFHYDNNPVLPLASLNKGGHVIYVGSFSKCLAPSVRIGYFVAPVKIIEAANKLRRIMDRQGDPLLERALSEFIKSGDLQRHLKKVVNLYRQRRDRLCSMLQEQLPKHITFTKPEGGMSVWVIFKNGGALKTLPARLAKEGYLLETDNIFIKRFRAVRIGFASLNDKEMERFVAALKKALKKP